jgi:hypothetical protein
MCWRTLAAASAGFYFGNIIVLAHPGGSHLQLLLLLLLCAGAPWRQPSPIVLSIMCWRTLAAALFKTVTRYCSISWTNF